MSSAAASREVLRQLTIHQVGKEGKVCFKNENSVRLSVGAYEVNVSPQTTTTLVASMRSAVKNAHPDTPSMHSLAARKYMEHVFGRPVDLTDRREELALPTADTLRLLGIMTVRNDGVLSLDIINEIRLPAMQLCIRSVCADGVSSASMAMPVLACPLLRVVPVSHVDKRVAASCDVVMQMAKGLVGAMRTDKPDVTDAVVESVPGLLLRAAAFVQMHDAYLAADNEARGGYEETKATAAPVQQRFMALEALDLYHTTVQLGDEITLAHVVDAVADVLSSRSDTPRWASVLMGGTALCVSVAHTRKLVLSGINLAAGQTGQWSLAAPLIDTSCASNLRSPEMRRLSLHLTSPGTASVVVCEAASADPRSTPHSFGSELAAKLSPMGRPQPEASRRARVHKRTDLSNAMTSMPWMCFTPGVASFMAGSGRLVQRAFSTAHSYVKSTQKAMKSGTIGSGLVNGDGEYVLHDAATAAAIQQAAAQSQTSVWASKTFQQFAVDLWFHKTACGLQTSITWEQVADRVASVCNSALRIAISLSPPPRGLQYVIQSVETQAMTPTTNGVNVTVAIAGYKKNTQTRRKRAVKKTLTLRWESVDGDGNRRDVRDNMQRVLDLAKAYLDQ